MYINKIHQNQIYLNTKNRIIIRNVDMLNIICSIDSTLNLIIIMNILPVWLS